MTLQYYCAKYVDRMKNVERTNLEGASFLRSLLEVQNNSSPETCFIKFFLEKKFHSSPHANHFTNERNSVKEITMMGSISCST